MGRGPKETDNALLPHTRATSNCSGRGRRDSKLRLPSSARFELLGGFSQSDPVALRGASITFRVLPVESRCAALRQVLPILVAVLVTVGCELSAVHLTLADIGTRVTGFGNGITTVRSIHDLAGRFHASGKRLFTIRHGGFAPVEFGLAILGCSR
jgi:hypothetical protein